MNINNFNIADRDNRFIAHSDNRAVVASINVVDSVVKV